MARQESNQQHWPEDAPWQRRRMEKDDSWMAFFAYLCMPPHERSISGAWHEFSGEEGRPPNKWYAWSRIHHWQERVVEFERWKRSQLQLEAEAAQAEETRRWENVRRQERERGLKVGQALIEKAMAMMNFPLAEVERVVSVYDDGKEKEVQIFKPARWNFGTVARMIEVGSKLVQLMSEMPTERYHLDLGTIYAEADKVAAQIGGGVTREDVLAMAEKIAQERADELDEEGGP